jgi:hypothetical protein
VSRTIQDVLADADLRDQLLDSARKRFQASASFMQPYHDKWVRFNKIYDNIVDAVEDEDEPNTGVVYAYKVVEDLVSKIAEPLLQLKPPCRVAPRSAHHEPQAQRFANMAAAYFRTGLYQEEYTMSVRECVITGNAWEKDCWFSEYETVRVWEKVKRTKIVSVIRKFIDRLTGETAAVPGEDEIDYTSPEEVPNTMPRRVGYGWEFPGIFRVFPEPGV